MKSKLIWAWETFVFLIAITLVAAAIKKLEDWIGGVGFTHIAGAMLVLGLVALITKLDKIKESIDESEDRYALLEEELYQWRNKWEK